MQYICLHELIYHLQTGRYSAGDDTDSSGGGGGAEKLKFDAEDPENGRMDTRIAVEVRLFAYLSTKYLGLVFKVMLLFRSLIGRYYLSFDLIG